MQTRVRLIETAEELFAERGLQAVSLRDVCAAAGQRNHSAAQYHFGDRMGLILAVFEHRMHAVNDRRHALLDLAADDDVEALVDAVVRPLTSVVAETNGWYARFLERIRWDPLTSDALAELLTWTSYERAVKALAARLPDLSPAVRANRIDQVGTLLIGTVAGWEWRRQRGQRALPVDELDRDLIATIVAVVTAASTPVPARHPTPWETR